jgi:hypothetical protein
VRSGCAPSRDRVTSFFAIALAATLAACADSHGPANVVEASYLAATVNGVRLPFELHRSGNTSYMLERDLLEFLSGSRARRTQSLRVVDEAMHTVAYSGTVSNYRVETVGDTVTLVPNCGPAALCLPPTRLIRDGDTFLLTLSTDPLRVMTLVRAALEE